MLVATLNWHPVSAVLP